jgi:DNA-binding GntR family transcriptional regulator
MTRDLARSDPPYQQIAADIRAQILSGTLPEGEPIPSARGIATEWGVALSTATKVLTLLRTEGLTRAVPGVGTVVDTSSRGHGAAERVLATRRSGHIYRPEEYARVLRSELVTAPYEIAVALGLPPESPVVRRLRLTMNGEQVVARSLSWLDGGLAEVAPRLLSTERIREGTFAYVEACTGRPVTTAREDVAADAATDDEAAALGIEVGSPVLRGRNWLLDSAGAVLEYGESVRPRRTWASYEVAMTS